jgi:hypothetical protein
MASVLENMLLGNRYIGVEFFSLNNQEKIAFLEVEKKRNELVISKREIFDSREDLTKVKSKLPVALIINNEQVLQKEILSKDNSDKKLLNLAFPNLQSDNFYYEIWRSEHTSVVAICRKIYVDELLESLKNVLKISSLNLGVTLLSQLEAFEVPHILTTNTQEITIGNDSGGTIIETAPNVAQYKINGLEVPNTHLLGFSGVLSLLLSSKTTGSISGLQEKLHEDYSQISFFDKASRAGIVILLVLLLGNFFLFTYYFDKVNATSDTILLSKAEIETTLKIKQRIKDKEEKLESFTNNAASGSSVIINNIIKEMPASLLLNELVYCPLEKTIKGEEAIITLDSLIILRGTTLSNSSFTTWVGSINRLKAIDKVTITSFTKNEDEKSAFSVNITLKR